MSGLNRNDIIRMAVDAGFEWNEQLKEMYTAGWLPDLIEKFANLVAAAEREACAKVCADIGKEYNNDINKKLGMGYEMQEVAFDCEEAILARGHK